VASLPDAVRLPAEFDRFLGDPTDPGSKLPFRALVDGDEASRLPSGSLEALTQWGYSAHLVPEHLGGRLGSPEVLLGLCRVLSRRSLTLAVAFGSTLLGANPVWLWGTAEQKASVADRVLGGASGGFALSEADHGSDLLASSTTAEPTRDGYLLRGTKWPAGNATRGTFVVVLAKTTEGPAHPRDLALFLLEKERLEPGRWANEPPIPTLGLRGHDLSGISFQNCLIPRSAELGDVCDGLGQTVKALQITKAFVSGLSLGAGDSALRLAVEYARGRSLYGKSAYDLPIIRHQLVEAYVDLVIAECVAIPVARSLSAAPARLPLWASVSKYVVPLLVDDLVGSTSEVLGARFYMRDGVYDGVFQKLYRDHAIAGIFEGTKQVNLHMVANQLPNVRRVAEANTGTTPGDPDLFRTLFSRVDDAPAWVPDGQALQMTNRGLDEFSQRWPQTATHILRMGVHPGATAAVRRMGRSVARLDEEWQRLWSDMDGVLARESKLVATPEGFHLAHRYCLLFAAAACAHSWLVNLGRIGSEFDDGAWLAACLDRVLVRLGVLSFVDYGGDVERMMLESCRSGGFSLVQPSSRAKPR
jgi:alkylation response protein AidB-like acyl-CoA dehydrogenase